MLFVVFEIVCFSHSETTRLISAVFIHHRNRGLCTISWGKKTQVFSYFIEKSFRLESENSVIMVLGAILQMSNQI